MAVRLLNTAAWPRKRSLSVVASARSSTRASDSVRPRRSSLLVVRLRRIVSPFVVVPRRRFVVFVGGGVRGRVRLSPVLPPAAVRDRRHVLERADLVGVHHPEFTHGPVELGAG